MTTKFTVNEQEFKVGDRVTAEVVWKDRRRTVAEGTLITVVDDVAYIETAFGAVAADANTLEAK
jgi:hypothetical protein